MDKYTENVEAIQDTVDGIINSFRVFIRCNDSASADSYQVNDPLLVDIALRIDQRKYYFLAFHGIKNISEYKEVSLIAFWILKLKPFSLTNEDSPIFKTLNEHFALHLILLAIKACCRERGIVYNHPNREFRDNIIYAFAYRDISKEALLLFVETLAFAYNVFFIENSDALKQDDEESHLTDN